MKIGDKVKVKDWGCIYTLYKQFMIVHGTKEQNKKWKPLNIENIEQLNKIMDGTIQNATYNITNIQPHTEGWEKTVAIIENETSVFMVDVEGLETVE